MKTPALVASLVLAQAFCHVDAATVLIDFSRTAVATGPDTNGNYWNSLGPNTTPGTDVAATALVSTTNDTLSWNVAIDTHNGNANEDSAFSGSAASTTITPDVGPFNIANAISDGLYVQDQAVTFPTITFTGLLASTQYDFSVVGGRTSNGMAGIIGVTTGTLSVGTEVSLPNNMNTITNFSITSNASGSIVLNFKTDGIGTGANESALLRAMSITQIPEPSHAALIGLSGLCFLVRRRR